MLENRVWTTSLEWADGERQVKRDIQCDQLKD